MLSNTKQERLRQSRQVNNMQSGTMCSARKNEMETSPQRTDRAIGDVVQNKAMFKIETETIS